MFARWTTTPLFIPGFKYWYEINIIRLIIITVRLVISLVNSNHNWCFGWGWPWIWCRWLMHFEPSAGGRLTLGLGTRLNSSCLFGDREPVRLSAQKRKTLPQPNAQKIRPKIYRPQRQKIQKNMKKIAKYCVNMISTARSAGCA